MARLELEHNEAGAVYVEFLLAFLPIFLMFLAICQGALLVAGRLVVSHAALQGARSAIVVLEDAPEHYAGAERGRLSEKPPSVATPSALDMLASVMSGQPLPTPTAAGPAKPPQQGARMQAIRAAALHPLAAIAPSAGAFTSGKQATLEASVDEDSASIQAFGRAYVEASAVVSVHDAPNINELAAEPIAPTAFITVRVTFLQYCDIPVVRALMCRSLSSLLDAPTPPLAGGPQKRSSLRDRLKLAGLPGWLESAAPPGSRFIVAEAQITLPNQGAAYVYAEHTDDQEPAL